jgi:ABC-type glutathione transport system ATPase component
MAMLPEAATARPEPVTAPRDRCGPKQPILEVRGLVKHFAAGWAFGQGRRAVRAVDGVSFEVANGETLGIVGESGCGKSTLARLIMRIAPADAGDMLFDGDPIGTTRRDLAAYRRYVQMVFQDSHASLNPRLTVEDTWRSVRACMPYLAAPRLRGRTICLPASASNRRALRPAIRTNCRAGGASASTSRGRSPLSRGC